MQIVAAETAAQTAFKPSLCDCQTSLLVLVQKPLKCSIQTSEEHLARHLISLNETVGNLICDECAECCTGRTTVHSAVCTLAFLAPTGSLCERLPHNLAEVLASCRKD